ncbi:MAG: hypothetical protein ACO1NT_06955 [Parapedobacter sp.]
MYTFAVLFFTGTVYEQVDVEGSRPHTTSSLARASGVSLTKLGIARPYAFGEYPPKEGYYFQLICRQFVALWKDFYRCYP